MPLRRPLAGERRRTRFAALPITATSAAATLKAQIEGGIGFALTNTLKSRITFSNGGAEQSNFSDYPLLRIDEMPEIVPIVLASDRPPQGVGEVVLAPVAPALAQALLHATGRRLDVMPFPDAAFRSND
jgi:isoquinoline 1-oxidoreductase subunit beta